MAMFELQKGKKESFTFMLKYDDGTPYNFANTTEVVVGFHPQEDGPSVYFKLTDSEITILSSCAGKAFVEMTGTKTQLLKSGEDLSFQVNVVKNNDDLNPDIIIFREAVTIYEQEVPVF